MSGRPDDKRRSSIALQAALVLILSKDEPHSLRLRRRMLQWMKQSHKHLFWLLEMMFVDRALDRRKLVDCAAQLESKGAASPLVGICNPASKPCASGIPAGCGLLTRRAAFAAGAAGLVLLLGLSVSGIPTDNQAVRHITLEDGSVMHVARGSDYEIEFDEKVRLVHLPRGHVVVEVAKDAERPFVLRSHSSDTVAVGTRFGVSADSTATITTVSEGAVRVVVPAGAELATGTLVKAGEELRVRAGASQPSSVAAVDAERTLSWSTGWLVFDGETVGEAVGTFNRFSDTHIEITQPELSETRLTFQRFAIDKPGPFAVGIAAALNVPTRADPDRNIIYVGEREP